MILLDTNVVSGVMRLTPDPRVVAWFDAQRLNALFLSSISVSELCLGVGLLPPGRQKDSLTAALDRILALFEGRILSFDQAAARLHATLALVARRAGRGFPLPDSYIAAIASLHGLTTAPRDDSAFVAAGLPVIN